MWRQDVSSSIYGDPNRDFKTKRGLFLIPTEWQRNLKDHKVAT